MRAPLILVFALLVPTAALAIDAEINCHGTLEAWRIDSQMRDYMRTHTCVCASRNSTPSCTASGSSGGGAQAPASARKHKTTNSDIMLGALKGALDDYAADSARISAAVAAQSRANQAMVKEQNSLKTELLRSEEAKKLAALEGEKEQRRKAAEELAGQLTVLPASAGLSLTGALEADARLKQQAAVAGELCRRTAAELARFQSGLEKLDADIAKNQRLIDDAKNGIKSAAAGAGKDVAGFFYNKKYDELEDRLKGFLQARKQLQAMRNEIYALEKAVGLPTGKKKLTPEQVAAAKLWIENGIKYSNDLVDSVKMSYSYNTDDSPAANDYQSKALNALDDFNTRFMNDAGAWEFAGEHLSEATFGPAGKLLFKQAVLGIKLGAAAGSMGIDAYSIKGLEENQKILEMEKARRLERIIALKKTVSERRCDTTALAGR